MDKIVVWEIPILFQALLSNIQQNCVKILRYYITSTSLMIKIIHTHFPMSCFHNNIINNNTYGKMETLLNHNN